jgi:UDP-N-acetylglucosamine--N-acetylmuramyl-(pentapeptide) pyrophosphoryl-undecaprenol N-acetylglucosamine transferase
MPDSKTIIIAAGGTGGHLYPGIALARELKGRGYTPHFILRTDDSGIEIIKREGFAFHEIPAMGMPRAISLQLMQFFSLQIKAMFRTALIFSQLHPDAVVGMGGYISFSSIVAARLMGIFTVVHEQNSIPGLANQVLSRLANRVAVSFEHSVVHFPESKTVVAGNPVRPELFNIDNEEALKRLNLKAGKFTVLIFGGSQGAAKINHVALEAYELLGDKKNVVQYLHITGQKDYERISGEFKKRNIAGVALPYLHSMGDAYAACDLVICRAGATTLAELKILNKPAILIPFPFATANHQEYNARTMAEGGKCGMIIEKNLDAHVLASAILKYVAGYDKGDCPLKLPDVFAQTILADIVVKGKS